MSISERISRSLAQLRDERGFSVDEIAARSGVSRAMIYRIESGQASPTVVVLNKLAVGLGVPLQSLLGPGDYSEPRLALRYPVASRRSQAVWQDRATGYSRRTLTPATADTPVRLFELRVPAGAHVTLESAFGEGRAHQQVWMLDGHIEARAGDEVVPLRSGDCMAMALGTPLSLHNPSSKAARCLLAALRAAR